ncbi:nitrogen regulation protein NR(I) [Xylella fastidiosa subsp. fastidiosa]|jgi:two-component system nitrogen regulation response regulator GlnG|uniref:DNA-binding transcriptional regulator NtrC n=2 Tax=Xylella fastidiosa TaxID=2371 RepID=Q87CP3_XYLFT|nr:nitrogen regulation protein NR(I) [Xylella fastidiosa]ADN64031.1 nitrogen metabolism transcriptional regulator, NtrC, Fis family protein [Xylella fastidiosa subsp. fastidiosa GB514]KAF0570302.1 nitrogen regulation protein NR(I) [Xylella fastidiosa subsp. fastidiosa Mus-1]AAO28882.1 two-component system, regulatory protein [Xylella fastidiosa Temecula1]ACB92513.1 nitrogen metabolism transcriptional regulator, NtrC, Fis Family [Xylella fastidiosa M23]EGO81942.1 Response regulator containing C
MVEIDATSPRIWVVDDDRSVRFVLSTALRDAGYIVEGFESTCAALQALAASPIPDLLFTDVRMPGDDGLILLDKLKARHPHLPVIVMSAYTDVASTAGAFRSGAHEFLSKPFDLDDAVALAARVLPHTQGSHGGSPILPAANSNPVLIGSTPVMRALFRAIGRLAQAPLSVLINGETGTGKELVARALHNESPRAQAPFVALNAAAIPTELLESELFGHEAGAFTGATKRHIGRFEQADGGTLFLDEIGDMPLSLQTRLLRVLAENEFFRVGGRELIRVNVRVITATHQDLDMLVEQGRFRSDLLHRLDVVRLQLPSLRERRDDVAQLAENFLVMAGHKLDISVKRLSADALEILRRYDWPGNVRELENICWRLAALVNTETIDANDVEAVLTHGKRKRCNTESDWDIHLAKWAEDRLAAGATAVHAEARKCLDRTLLDVALRLTQGRRAEAAARLGLGRNTLTRKLGSSQRRRR